MNLYLIASMVATARMYIMTYDQSMVVSAQEICDIISNLTQGKAPGKDKLTTEHLKFAGLNLPILLSVLCTYMLVHGYMPSTLISTVIVPIIKDKNKRIGDKNNYRPIGLSNIFTQIFEYVLMNRMKTFLPTTYNQFGSKAKHGTYMCVFMH